MAENGWGSVRPLIDILFDEPHRFDLMQALSILERSSPHAVSLGLGIDPELEAVRLEQDASLAFPASDVSGLRTGTDDRPILRTPVFGMSGISGPLPYAFTESLLERVSRRDRSMAAFFDIFNHRLISLLYRVRKTSAPVIGGHPEDSLVADALRALVGIGMETLRNRDARVPDRILLSFAAIIAERRGSAAGLSSLLTGVFGTRVDVEQFSGRWLPLPDHAQTVLSRHAPVEPRRLGGSAVLGSRVWDQHAGISLRAVFVTLADFEAFLPDGRHHPTLISLTRFRIGPVTDILLDLVLTKDAVPPLKLSKTGGSKLGWTSWLTGAGGKAREDGRIRIAAGALS